VSGTVRSDFRIGRVRSEISVPACHGPELITTGLIVRQYIVY